MRTHAVTNIAGTTDVGQVRQVNEDAILVNNELQLYAIADGMGGHGAGEIASTLAVETLQSCIASDAVAKALANKDISDEQAQGLIYQCIVGVNQRIYQENVKNRHPDGTGMGTTLVGFCVIGDRPIESGSVTRRAISFNVGDSRLYEYQDTKLAQLTQDHTMYREWEEAGQIGPAPSRNIIMRAMGLFADVDIDMDVISIQLDATYLLCSDGLTGMVTDDQIASILAQPFDAETLCKTLVQHANQNGGNDNISVVTVTPLDNN